MGVDSDALGPPDPRRAWERERSKDFERMMNKTGPPPHPPGSMEDRRIQGEKGREQLRLRRGTGFSPRTF